MTALSIRNRVEYAFVGLVFLTAMIWLIYYLFQLRSGPAALAGSVCIMIGLDVSSRLIFFPPNISPSNWWRDFSKPATIGTFEGQMVYERRDILDFRRIYDHTGKFIATEQTIDWSSTDMDWNPGDPEDIQIIINRFPTGEQLSWLAMLRSPKLPVGNEAEVINGLGEIVGRTTYKSS